ncbi:AAA family ATPase [Mannheimia haemolytica]|uniref:ATP-dependent nuclease n=1 Tax=Mannheimia haemolytica TaxID=75985 RepID=UPI00201CA5D2|nr:AAA family ATPase [Mannheimia haemolytica]UQX77384.1 AAA family ATPase [Mannheimia haemolytica]
MKFRKLKIVNFRNFDNCEIELSNKNLIFGMNDVGKSNLIYALRLLFDSKTRNNQIYDTDFHTCNKSNPIEISCYLDVSEENDFNDIIIAKSDNAIIDNTELFVIKLTVEFSGNQFTSNLSWGSENEELIEIPMCGLSRTMLDEIFYCVFIPSQNDISSKFKDFKKELLNNYQKNDADINIESEIKQLNQSFNQKISNLSTIKTMESSLNEQLDLFDKNYKIKIYPSHTFGDLHNNLDIFMFDSQEDDIEPQFYPTSGDGRIRKVMYALISYLLNNGVNANGKIPVLLIEEPENHLFLSSQIELSKTIFNEEFSPYLFLVTHSPQLFFKISNEANLIRLFKQNQKIEISSEIANIGDDYNSLKNILIENLAQCLFVNRVLLVEGPSEKLLFEWILDTLGYDRTDIAIQSISGVYFDKYVQILNGLGIKIFIKTDNDISKVPRKNELNALGFNRCVVLYNQLQDNSQKENLATVPLAENIVESGKLQAINVFRNQILENQANDFYEFAELGIYLSKIDLENDLAECLDKDDGFVKDLQESKWVNMWNLIQNLSKSDAEKIFNHENFKCLRDLINE